MTDDKNADDTPEEVTMKDLWRHISGLKGEIQGVRSELKEEIQGVRSEMNERFDTVDKRFDDQDKQLEAIRNVTDNELARHADLVRVENKVSDAAADVRQLKGDVRKVQSRLDRGGIPA